MSHYRQNYRDIENCRPRQNDEGMINVTTLATEAT